MVLQVLVEYRLSSSSGWTATLRSVEGSFPTRNVHARDAEGIFIAVLMAIEALRVESGRLVETEQIVYGAFAADVRDCPWCGTDLDASPPVMLGTQAIPICDSCLRELPWAASRTQIPLPRLPWPACSE
jgi:hypothetical protein